MPADDVAVLTRIDEAHAAGIQSIDELWNAVGVVGNMPPATPALAIRSTPRTPRPSKPRSHPVAQTSARLPASAPSTPWGLIRTRQTRVRMAQAGRENATPAPPLGRRPLALRRRNSCRRNVLHRRPQTEPRVSQRPLPVKIRRNPRAPSHPGKAATKPNRTRGTPLPASASRLCAGGRSHQPDHASPIPIGRAPATMVPHAPSRSLTTQSLAQSLNSETRDKAREAFPTWQARPRQIPAGA